MKYILFTVCLLAGFFTNCKKEHIIVKTPLPIDTIVPIDTVEHIIELGKSSVLKNGIIWNVPFKALYHYSTKNRFLIKAKSQLANSLSEFFIIEDIPLQKGKHFIEYAQQLSDLTNFVPNAGFNMSNYDEGVGNFYPDVTRSDNFIEVLSYDTISNEVEGRFQVFLLEPGGPSTLPGVPDSVFMTEGKFYLKIQ